MCIVGCSCSCISWIKPSHLNLCDTNRCVRPSWCCRLKTFKIIRELNDSWIIHRVRGARVTNSIKQFGTMEKINLFVRLIYSHIDLMFLKLPLFISESSRPLTDFLQFINDMPTPNPSPNMTGHILPRKNNTDDILASAAPPPENKKNIYLFSNFIRHNRLPQGDTYSRAFLYKKWIYYYNTINMQYNRVICG